MTARLWYLAVGAVLGAFACSSTPAVIQNAATGVRKVALTDFNSPEKGRPSSRAKA